ncbi:hypothetical protein [Carboxylicivirga sp. RSCT41]|uniref:hypothetical protein n=1 Tax=Carboxylicivirga agarovorans TaxID=3417570 RepID=UPI003D328C8B
MKYTSLKIDSHLLFMDKTDEINHEISSFLSDLSIAPTTIVKVECYAPVKNNDELTTCTKSFDSVVSEVFKDKIPANLFVAKELADDATKALLKFCICDEKSFTIEYKEFQKFNYCVVKNNEETILISGGISFDQSGDKLRLVQSTFDFMEQLLDHEEMHFGHVSCQTNFINDIQGKKADTTTGWTNVQTINEIRTLYFDPNLFKHGYPLQHTMNSDTDGFVIDFIAAVKDGFPTAQYNLDAESEQTQNCFIPGLNKFICRPPVNSGAASSKGQLEEALTSIIQSADNCGLKLNKKADEVKITIPDNKDLEEVQHIISKQIDTNKLVIFHSTLESNDLKMDIEIITSVIL